MINMEDSWQKLMGIDSGSEDGPSSPIFHKQKWVILPKSLKRSASIPLLNLSPEQESKNFNDVSRKRTKIDTVSSVQAEISPHNNLNVDSDRDNKDDALLIYNTTPTKQYKHKRKSIDLLSCSFKSEDGCTKKFKINGSSHKSALVSNSNDSLNESTSETNFQPSTSKRHSLLPLDSKCSNSTLKTTNLKTQRKLLYANNEASDVNSKVQKVTVDDVYKSVIMIDEADLRSSPKKIRQISFRSELNDFQTVTSLNNKELENNIDVDDLPVSNYNNDDSFRDCMFTEIEKECLNVKLGSLQSNIILERVIDNPSSSEDNNLMDDSLGNCGFTEIEEDYSCLKQSKLYHKDMPELHSPSKSLAVSQSSRSVLPKSSSLMHRASVENSESNDRAVFERKGSCNSGKSQCKDVHQILSMPSCLSNNQIFFETVDEINPHLVGNNETSIVSAVKDSKVMKVHSPINRVVNTSPNVLCCSGTESSNKVSKLLETLTPTSINAIKLISFPEHNLQDPSSESNDEEKDLFNSTVLPSKSVLEAETVKDTEHYFSNSKESFIDLDSISTGGFKHTNLIELNANQHEIVNNKTLDQSFQEDIVEQDILNSSVKSNLSFNTTLTGRMKQFLSKKICSLSNKSMKFQEFDISFNKDFTKSDEISNGNNSEIHCNRSRSQSPLLQTSADLTTVLKIPGRAGDSSEEYLQKLKSNSDNDNTVLYYEQCFDDIISAEVKSRLSNICEIPGETQGPLILEKSLCTEVDLPNDINDKLSFGCLKSLRSSDCDENICNEVKTNCGEKVSSSLLPQSYKITSLNMKESEEPSNKPVEESTSSNFELIECDNVASSCTNYIRESEKVFSQKISCINNVDKFSFNEKDVLSQNSLQQFNSSFKNAEDGSNCSQIKDNSTINELKHSNIEKKFGEKGFKGMKTNNFMFSTAGGKNINVSEDCLKIVKSKFKDILEDSSSEIYNNKGEDNQNINDNMAVPSTSTMGMIEKSFRNSNKPTFSESDFSFSQNCLQQFNSSFKSSQQISSCNEIPENSSSSERTLINLEKSLYDKGFQGSSTNRFMFMSAGGKNINVSEDCLKKVKSKYKDILEDSSDQTNDSNSFLIKDEIKTSDTGKDCSPEISSPQVSSSRKNVSSEIHKPSSVDSKELVASGMKSCFNNVYDGKMSTSYQRNDFLNKDTNEKKSNISPVLEKTVSTNCKIANKISPVFFKKPISPINYKKTPNNFEFLTALGKNVNASEESLKNVKSNSTTSVIFSGHSTLKNINSPLTPIAERVNDAFQESKEVKFNNSSFHSKDNFRSGCEFLPGTSAKDKILFNMNDKSKGKSPLKNSCKSVSFSTAAGKNISVSDDILAKMKSKFSDVLDMDDHLNENFPYSKQVTNDTETDMLSFNKEIRSVTSLKKEQLNFGTKLTNTCYVLNKKDVLPVVLPHLKEKPSIPESFSFSTASGNITETSLIGEKLNDAIRKYTIDSKSSDKISHAGSNINMIQEVKFSTAGGKSIHVSESTLAKVKSKFSDTLELTGTCAELEKSSWCTGMAAVSSLKDKIINESKEALAQTNSESSGLFNDPQKDGDQFENSLRSKSVFDSLMASTSRYIDTNMSEVKSEFSEFLEQSPPQLLEDVLTDELRENPLQNFSLAESCLYSNTGIKNVKVSEDASANNKQLPESSMNTLSGYASSLKPNECFTFSTGHSKIVDVSKKALAQVKSNFNQLKNPLLLEESSDYLLSENLNSKQGLSSAGGFMFSSASGKSVCVSEDALSKAKAKFNDVFEQPFSPHTDDMPLKSDDKSSEKSLPVKKTAQLVENFMFSTAGGKNIGVSEDAFAKVKSIFNDEFENPALHLAIEDQINIYDNHLPKNPVSLKKCFENAEGSSFTNICNVVGDSVEVIGKSQNKFNDIFHNPLSDLIPKEQILGKNSLFKELSNVKLNINTNKEISGPPNKRKCDDVANILLKNYDSKCSFSESDNSKAIDHRVNNSLHSKIFVENMEQIGRKSKSPHSENLNSQQPFKKKICFHAGFTDSPLHKLEDEFKNDEPRESFPGQFPFTQSISQSLLDNEVDTIEKNITINDSDINKKNEFQREMNQSKQCVENKELTQNKKDAQFDIQESDLSVICEVSDSTAAFMADCTPDRSVLSSPSSFFNRRKMKPINLLNIEFDDADDELMAEAESTIISIYRGNISVNCSPKENFLVGENLRSCSAEILTIRKDQRTQADKLIKDKHANRLSVVPGLYMSLRNQGRHTSITDSPLSSPQLSLTKDQLLQLGLLEDVVNVTSTNAADFKFCAENFFSHDACFSTNGSVDVGSGFFLILSDDNKIGLEEFSRSFLVSPNVDPSLVTPCWVKNHFRWIVWKLASYEKAFPTLLSHRYLTPENVLHQLKYRYDREIDLAQRSALKRILECDEPSSRRLITCIADIRKVDLDEGDSSFEIELTDGWYSVWTNVDPAMINLIKKGKVKIGTKLVSQSVELLNCADGCDPLELTDTVRLKLHTNCSRRVKWNTKMGFTKCPGPIYVSLNSIFHNGGLIGLTSAIIIRVYPLLFMSKDADGKTVIRNAHAENQMANLKQNNLSLKSEELYEKFLPEVELKYKTNCKVKFERNKIKQIKDPELLWKIISNESDPSEIQALMSNDQLLEVQKYHDMISSKIREEVQTLVKEELQDLMPSQKAKPLLKLRLVDPFADYSAFLTVWNPSEELRHLLAEKKCFDFYGLNASGIRDKVLQLSSTNRTIYEESKVFKPSQKYGRKITFIADIASNAVSSHFGELDVVGIVIFVKEPEKPWGVTNVYLSDAQENFLMITFWTSLKTFGCEDVLKPGSAVACVNLQWRHGSGSYVIPSTYANELTSFSSNPSQEYLSKELQTIKAYLKSEDISNFKVQKQRKLFTLLKEREFITRTPPVKSADTPKVLKRLENLKRYGEASPLPNMSLMSSPDIYRKFRSPKSGTS